MAGALLWQRYGVTLQSAQARLLAGFEAGALILIASRVLTPARTKSDTEPNTEPTAGSIGAKANLNRPLGFIWAVERGAFARSAYIPLLAVDLTSRGQGVGTRLLAAAEERLGKHTADVFLLCAEFNSEAQRFYQRQGYKIVGTLPDYVMPGITEIIFRKQMG